MFVPRSRLTKEALAVSLRSMTSLPQWRQITSRTHTFERTPTHFSSPGLAYFSIWPSHSLPPRASSRTKTASNLELPPPTFQFGAGSRISRLTVGGVGVVSVVAGRDFRSSEQPRVRTVFYPFKRETGWRRFNRSINKARRLAVKAGGIHEPLKHPALAYGDSHRRTRAVPAGPSRTECPRAFLRRRS